MNESEPTAQEGDVKNHTEENVEPVMYWLSPDSTPLSYVISPQEAVRRAINLTGETHTMITGTKIDVADPPKGNRPARVSHNLMLLLLDNTSVDYGVITEVLGHYKTEASLKRAIARAHQALEKDDDLARLYRSLRGDYSKKLIGLKEPQIVPRVQGMPANRETPVTEGQESQVSHEMTPEQWLYRWRTSKSEAAEDALTELLGETMDQCIDSVRGSLRTKVVDIAWNEFYRVLDSSVPWERLPSTLQRRIIMRIASLKKTDQEQGRH